MKARRLRTFTLWTGTTLSLLIAAVFVASAWWYVAFQASTPFGTAIYLAAGSVMIVAEQTANVPLAVQGSDEGLSRWNSWHGTWSVYLTVPLYAVFAAVAVPTLLVWRFGPKPVKPGHCRCGYDLTGNESGVCPECGMAAGESHRAR